ncbi:MAG: DUF4131 domain-containing protein, partial [Puniceicoccales bacterium]|nr:DUF4131 domain-containing protein [Puniceicoccales bacterium]
MEIFQQRERIWHVPIIPYFCTFSLCILFHIGMHCSAAIALIFLLIYYLYRWSTKQWLIFIPFVLISFAWIHWRMPNVPNARISPRRTFYGKIFLDRCNVKEYNKGMRINGFGTIIHCNALGGETHCPIYYNLAVKDGESVPHRGQVIHASFHLHDTRMSQQNFEQYLAGVGVHHKADRGSVIKIVHESQWNHFINFLVE